MKKMISIVFLFICLMTMEISLQAAITPQVNVDGKNITLNNETGFPVNQNGSIVVPIRVISENLGYNVGWDSESKTVTISNDTTKVELVIGQKKAMVNEKELTLAAPAQIISARTYVPLRFVAESFNCGVTWKNTTKTVYIRTDGTKVLEGESLKALVKDNVCRQLLIGNIGVNDDVTVIRGSLEEGITLKTFHLFNEGDTFTITGMEWLDPDTKTLVTMTANGNTEVRRAFKVSTIKNGAITDTFCCRSVYDLGNDKLEFEVDADDLNAGTHNFPEAEQLLFTAEKGYGILIDNPLH